jgi:hypothetical protein
MVRLGSVRQVDRPHKTSLHELFHCCLLPVEAGFVAVKHEYDWPVRACRHACLFVTQRRAEAGDGIWYSILDEVVSLEATFDNGDQFNEAVAARQAFSVTRAILLVVSLIGTARFELATSCTPSSL